MNRCPVCQNSPGTGHATVGEYTFLECADCTHVFLDLEAGPSQVEEVYDDKYFTTGGQGYEDYFAESELITNRGRLYTGILGEFADPGRLLDVGCASGFTSLGFSEKGWEVEGVEPNSHMAECGRQSYGMNIRTGDLESLSEATVPFRAITAIQVAAHFYDVRRAFERFSELLEDEGLLLIETWNYRSGIARLLGAGWHEFSPPSVLNCFSRRSLDLLAAQFGFRKLESRLTFKSIKAGHARSLLAEKAERSPVMKAAELVSRIIPAQVSVIYPADDLFWVLYQKA